MNIYRSPLQDIFLQNLQTLIAANCIYIINIYTHIRVCCYEMNYNLIPNMAFNWTAPEKLGNNKMSVCLF